MTDYQTAAAQQVELVEASKKASDEVHREMTMFGRINPETLARAEQAGRTMIEGARRLAALSPQKAL